MNWRKGLGIGICFLIAYSAQCQNWQAEFKALRQSEELNEVIVLKDDALKRISKAKELLPKVRNNSQKLYLASLISSDYYRLGEYQEVIDFVNEIRPKHSSSILEKKLYHDVLYQKAGSFALLGIADSALYFHKKVLENRKSLKPVPVRELANSYSFTGYTYRYVREDSYTSLKYYLKEMDIREKMPEDTSGLAKCCYNLAAVYGERGEYSKALSYALRAYNLTLPFAGHENFKTMCLDMLAYVHFHRDNYREAIKYYRTSLDKKIMAGQQLEKELYWNYSNISSCYIMLDDLDSSAFYLSKTYEILKKYYDEDSDEMVQWHAEMCSIYHETEEGREYGLEGVRRAKAHFKKTGVQLYYPYFQLARWYGFNSNYDSAIYYYDQAIFLTVGYENISRRAKSFSHKGQTCLKYGEERGDSKLILEAIECFKQADSLLADMRGQISGDESRVEFHEQKFEYYSKGLAAAIKLSSFDAYKNLAKKEAWFFMERSKATSLSEALYQSDLLGNRGVQRELIHSLNSVESRRNSLQKDLVNEKTAGEAREELLELSREEDSLNGVLNTQFPNLAKARRGESISLDEARKKLQPDEVILQYMEGKGNYYSLKISRGTVVLDTVSSVLVDSMANELFILLQKGFSWDSKEENYRNYVEAARQLYNLLIGDFPVEGQHITVIPAGLIGRIPFDVLLTADPKSMEVNYRKLPYLINGSSVNYAYSATWLFDVSAKVKKRKSSNKLLAYAYSDEFLRDGNKDMAVLPGSYQEVKSISELWKDEISFFAGRDATEQSFKQSCSDYQFLHLALHNISNLENPYEAGLVFNKNEDPATTKEDGILHLYEMYALQSSARMVVLSACESGYGKIRTGEGVFSLGRAFAFTGVPTTIVSLWKISDDKSSEIIEAFYRKFGEGKSAEQALRYAKLEYLRKADEYNSHPSNWGAFAYIGPDQELEDHSSATAWILPLLGISLLAFLGLTAWKRRNNKKVA